MNEEVIIYVKNIGRGKEVFLLGVVVVFSY